MADLYFASQAEADRYVIEHQIAIHMQTPVRRITRSTAPRAAALERLERSRDALSAPIYKLSDDIFREIFVTATWKDGYGDAELSLILSQVVSRWRRMLLETPSFWTSFGIDVGSSAHNHHACRLFGPRSGCLPLKLEVMRRPPKSMITMPYAGPDLDARSAEAVLKLFNGRCSVLEIRQAYLYFLVRDHLLRKIDMPMLTEVALVCRDEYVTFDKFCHTFSALPSLRLWRLRSATALHIKCRTDYDGDIKFLRYDCPPYPLRDLRTLCLDTSCILDGFKNFKCPSVTSFTLSIRKPAPGLDVLCLICNLPALEELFLTIDVENPDQTLTCPRPIPHLDHINFFSSKNIDVLARFLVGATTTETDRPSLGSVHLSSTRVTQETLGWIQDRVLVH